jgi:transaldolase
VASKWLEIGQYGQSVWYDNVARPAVETGLLARVRDEDAVTGGTSNPSIFAKAVEESGLYDDAIRAFDASATPAEVFLPLAVADIQAACDVMQPVAERTSGADGFISIEVEADLAHDADGTVARAHELHALVNRPNVLIKVPGTAEGVDAIRRLIRDGISINVTLLFSVERYRDVAEAYVAAIGERVAAGEAVDGIHSVASFFVSRIDTKVDALLPDDSPLRGRTAIANAKIAYADVYQRIFENGDWATLAAKGGNAQRALWASTGTKDPAYSPTLYVDELIGPNTVNTVPDATLEAFRTGGHPAPTLTAGLDEARQVMEGVAAAGIDFAQVTADLEVEGVRQFADAYTGMLTAIESRRAAMA